MATCSTKGEINEGLMKEIKVQLKQARDLINLKDHKAALNLCENIVKKDKSCYTAWIMIAACAQELKQFHQAQVALNKAIELDENQPLAYQGFIQLAERAPDFLTTSDVTSSYRKVCSFYRTRDSSKFSDFAKKFIDFMRKQIINKNEQNLNLRIQICELCKDLTEDRTINLPQDEERRFRLLTVELIENVSNISVPLKEFLANSFFWLSQSGSDEAERLILYEKYLRSLCQIKAKGSDIVDYSNECLKLFPESTFALDAIIWIELESILPQIYENLAPVAKLTDVLNRIRPKTEQNPSALFICAKSFFLIRNRQFSKALELLLSAPTTDDGFHLVSILKTVSYANLHLIQLTDDSIPKTRAQLSAIIVQESISDIESLLDLCSAMVTYDQGKYEKSLTYFDKLLQMPNKFHRQAISGQFYANCDLNRAVNARECYERVQARLDDREDLSFRLQLSFIEDHPVDLLKTFLTALQQAEEEEQSLELTVHGWLTVGRAYLAIQRSNDLFDKQKCKRAFEKTIELDPYFWQTYACLSQYYEEIEESLSEAMACSKRAFQLNEFVEAVQIRYVDHLLQADEISIAVEILERLIAEDNMKTWAQCRLGLISIRLKNVYQAVKILQIVSRRPGASGATWSALGDAHLHTNNLNSALICYSKASALESETLYSVTREALTLTLLGRYNEAIRKFDKVLEQSPKYLLARKGKGEAFLYLAMQQIGSYKDELAVSSVQQSLTAFHDALCLQDNFSCIWKKYGDACMILHPVNEKLINIRLPPLVKNLDENKIKTVDGCVNLRKFDILQRAEKCFMKAIQLKPRSALYWSSLAQCLYVQARLKSNDKQLLAKSFEYMKVSVSLKPNDYLLWNSLGVIAANPVLTEAGFSQHCFLKSLQLQRSAVAYTNLGLLFYRHENLDLANKAFSNAQQTEPSYPIAWIGQAMIAEKLAYDDSIDLYRHSTELSNHSQGLFGYGKMIAKLLVDPNKKSTEAYRYGVTFLSGNERAGDALTKFIQRNPQDWNALHCLGIIHEFNQRFNMAVEAYQLCFTQLDVEANITKRIRNDYARALCRSGRAKIEAFALEGGATLLDVLWFVNSCVKLDQRTKGIETLKRIVDDAETTNRDRSILLAFLGIIQEKVDRQSAVKSLFKSYSTKENCSNAVRVLCAMGIIIGDGRISAAALKEMPQIFDSNYDFDVHGLTCLSLIAAKNFKEFYSYAMNAAFLRPWAPWTWIFASIAVLETGKNDSVLKMLERIFVTNFFLIDQRMIVLIAKLLDRISSEKNDRILRLFRILIFHFPMLIELRISFSRYIRIFDFDLGRSVSVEKI